VKINPAYSSRLSIPQRHSRFVVTFLLAVIVSACGGGGGSGNVPTPIPIPDPDPVFQIALIADIAMPMNSCMAPLFAPGDLANPIVATTVDLLQHNNDTGFTGDQAPIATFPRHLTDGGPTLTLDSGLELTDDIRLIIGVNQADQFVSVQVKGQPLIGANSLSHASEVILFTQSVDAIDTQAFVAHMDTMQPVPMWELANHLGGAQVQIVGYFCLGDMEFTPIP